MKKLVKSLYNPLQNRRLKRR